ncbi:MAG: glycosyltransferase family A protein [Candidatus Solibacter sp.]
MEELAPDFVLSASSTQPKLVDIPHYGVIHEPRDCFFANRHYFNNIVTYDGYLTISETLERFLTDISVGVGRPKPVGYYYNSCQRHAASADLEKLIAARELRITYFGTNWDRRRESFFRVLSYSPGVEICGPEHAWPVLAPGSYGGATEFDGTSVQERYAKNGIGLVLLSNSHLRDDCISNRIFEITSVGAIALCCDIPWIRNNFGDSVYYFEQNLPDKALCREIAERREEIYRHPEIAMEKARRAREIFEAKFAAEILLQNAVDYHEKMSERRAAGLRSARKSYSPLISVIVRCGCRGVEFVERAISSISRQTYGKFEVVLVRHQELDLSPLLNTRYPNIEAVRVIECSGGNRSASLWAGLGAVGGQYFAVLDDDDWWFSNHFETLFRVKPASAQSRFFAFSGSIAQLATRQAKDGCAEDSRAVHSMGFTSQESWRGVVSIFASNCFVASTDLLTPDLLTDPQMETSEDSYLIASLMAQADPRFSYAATSVFDRSLADQSDFTQHPRRFEDELSLQLRMLSQRPPSFLQGDVWASLVKFWGTRPAPAVSPFAEAMLRENYGPVSSGYVAEKSAFDGASVLTDPATGGATIRPNAAPWSYAVLLSLNAPEQKYPQYQAVFEVLVHKGTIGIGVLNPDESDFLFRQTLTESPKPQSIEFPIADLDKVGRVVVQNWVAPGEADAEILSIRLLAEIS